MTLSVLACLLVLVALGVAERLARDRCWRAVGIRVHVNGTRGKSTVTRLVWSALREAGVPAMAKTTGTAARLLLPDGTEQPVVRRSPPTIREQLAFLRRASRLDARAVVVECMALQPELQWRSEREMVRATIGVITNVRLDHSEVMGNDLDTIAETLANSIPRSAVLVTGDDRFLPTFTRRAAALGTSVVSSAAAREDIRRLLPAEAPESAGEDPVARASTGCSTAAPWLLEDMATALTVTRQLGIDDAVAVRGFAAAPPDPGAARQGTVDINGGTVHWLDATAANDPESLQGLALEAIGGNGPWEGPPSIVVYNHRADRPARLDCFARHSEVLARAGRLVVTGERPPWTVWQRLRRARKTAPGDSPLVFVPAARLAADIRRQRAGSTVLFCGNTRGLDLARLLEEVGSDG